LGLLALVPTEECLFADGTRQAQFLCADPEPFTR
jgi:hypothetical protein